MSSLFKRASKKILKGKKKQKQQKPSAEDKRKQMEALYSQSRQSVPQPTIQQSSTSQSNQQNVLQGTTQPQSEEEKKMFKDVGIKEEEEPKDNDLKDDASTMAKKIHKKHIRVSTPTETGLIF